MLIFITLGYNVFAYFPFLCSAPCLSGRIHPKQVSEELTANHTACMINRILSLFSGYLQKLWRCYPFSIPRVGRTHRPASRRPAAACCSPCPPPEVLRTPVPGAGLAPLRRGCRRAAPRPAAVLLLGHAGALLTHMQNNTTS